MRIIAKIYIEKEKQKSYSIFKKIQENKNFLRYGEIAWYGHRRERMEEVREKD